MNWKIFKEEKPEIGVEVLAFNPNWIHEDYNKNGIRVGFLNGDENGEFVSATFDNEGDTYENCEKFHPEKWTAFVDKKAEINISINSLEDLVHLLAWNITQNHTKRWGCIKGKFSCTYSFMHEDKNEVLKWLEANYKNN